MSYLIAALLLSPLLIFLVHLEKVTSPLGPEFLRVFTQTFAQAALSSGLALVFGIIGGLGLLKLAHSKWKKPVEIFVMLPSLLPPLFVIVATMNVVTAWTKFPFGLWGVVLIHVIMNVGVVSVVVARRMESLGGEMIELAAVEGASRWQIFRGVIGAIERDLLLAAFFVFALSFTAFSVPLIVGADRGETLEALIYRAVMARGDLGYAMGLAIVQVLIIASMSFLVRHRRDEGGRAPRYFSSLPSTASLAVLMAATGLLFVLGLRGFVQGAREILNLAALRENFLMSAVGTFIECLFVGAFAFTFLYGVAYAYPHAWLHRLLRGYSAPSAVIAALALFLVYDFHSAVAGTTIVGISFGFAVLILPSLYRFRADGRLNELKEQILSAKILGASRWRVFRRVIVPQVRRDFSFLAGVAAVWASGDFAFASLVAGRELTLAISAQNYLGGYRLELATTLTWCSLFVGLLVFFAFDALGSLSDKKSHS